MHARWVIVRPTVVSDASLEVGWSRRDRGRDGLGVAAGTTTVRRRRREFIDANPDELRTRLHARFREAEERQAV